MPGIARRRRQPRSWSAARRSARPVATSRAARRSAIARPADRSRLCSSAGAVPARRSGVGRSRRPVSAQRRPRRATIRRWMTTRAVELDELLADRPGQRLERVGTARRAQPRAAPQRRADQRVEPEALVERAQVVVDAEREAHPRDRLLGHAGVLGPGAEHDRVGARLRDSDDGAACPRRAGGARAPGRGGAGSPSRPTPGRRKTHAGRTSRRTSTIAATLRRRPDGGAPACPHVAGRCRDSVRGAGPALGVSAACGGTAGGVTARVGSGGPARRRRGGPAGRRRPPCRSPGRRSSARRWPPRPRSAAAAPRRSPRPSARCAPRRRGAGERCVGAGAGVDDERDASFGARRPRPSTTRPLPMASAASAATASARRRAAPRRGVGAAGGARWE